MTSLYTRMRTHGTLTETPDEIPDAVFALPSTLNWMRAEAILVSDCALDFSAAQAFYGRVQRKELSERQLNSVFEQLLFSLHQTAALRGIAAVPNKADVARVGIVTWYYGVYGAASAMIAAADGSFPETHASTARQWDRQIVEAKLAMAPFSDRLGSLVKSDVERDLTGPRSRGSHSLTSVPKVPEQAWGCHAEYLSGTASWEQWNLEQQVRNSREFKAMEVENFRTKAARALRDEALGRKSICFLHEASRYRGKARLQRGALLPGHKLPHLRNELPLEGWCGFDRTNQKDLQMKQCKNSEIRKLVKDEVSKGGWFVMGRKHAKLYLSCGGFVTVPLTPSDKRSSLNFRTNLRRTRQLRMSGGPTR